MKKVIVIASAVISILFTIFLIANVTKPGAYISDGMYYLTRPIKDILILNAITIFLVFISILVIFNRKLPKVFRILSIIISIIFMIVAVIVFSNILSNLITGARPLNYFGIINIVSLMAIIITLLTYIRRALKPAEIKEKKNL